MAPLSDQLFPEAGRGGDGSARGEAPRQVSLVRLSAELARSAASLGRVAVDGEVVNPTVRPSGRIYLTLRDRAARIGVVCPAARARRCRAVHGERVRVTGRVEYLSQRGQLQLIAEEVVPVGAGALAAAIAEARARLAEDGILDRPRRPIPLLPTAIGVVCGGSSAVREDIESVVEERFPGYPVTFAEVGVSGMAAAGGIAEALARLTRFDEVSVVVLARGGGDAVDLLAFSDEDLCRQIAACPVPVVSAIGHHGDRPLCDEVADLRCATPSLAAAAVVPDEAALLAGIDGWLASAGVALDAAADRARLVLEAADPMEALDAGLSTAAQRLVTVSGALGAFDLGGRVHEAETWLGSFRWREPLSRRMDNAEDSMVAMRRTIDALDPARVLERGFAVVTDRYGRVVRSHESVHRGDVLEVALARGRLRVSVEETGQG